MRQDTYVANDAADVSDPVSPTTDRFVYYSDHLII